MTVADLFVNIGVKGADQSAKALNSVQTGLKGVESSGLAAKAALLAVFYMAEQAITGAAKFGADIKTFSEAFDIDPKTIQNFRYSIGQIGNAGEGAVDNALQTFQKLKAAYVSQGTVPDFFNHLIGNMGFANPDEAFKNIEVFYDRFQEYSKKQKDKNLVNQFASGVGITPQMRAALEGLKNPVSSYRNPYAISRGQEEGLNSLNKRWVNIFEGLKKFSRDFASRFGPDITKGIELALVPAEKLANWFMEMAKSSLLIKGAILAAMALMGPLSAAIASVVAGIWFLAEWQKHSTGEKDNFFDNTAKWGEEKLNQIKELPTNTMEFMSGRTKELPFNKLFGLDYAIPSSMNELIQGKGVTNNYNVDVKVQGEVDHHKVKNIFMDALKGVNKTTNKVISTNQSQ